MSGELQDGDGGLMRRVAELERRVGTIAARLADMERRVALLERQRAAAAMRELPEREG